MHHAGYKKWGLLVFWVLHIYIFDHCKKARLIHVDFPEKQAPTKVKYLLPVCQMLGNFTEGNARKSMVSFAFCAHVGIKRHQFVSRLYHFTCCQVTTVRERIQWIQGITKQEKWKLFQELYTDILLVNPCTVYFHQHLKQVHFVVTCVLP